MLLADFARPSKGAAVCDLCAGAGAVGLLLLAREESLHVTAVELQEAACQLARRNLADNHLEGRMDVVQGDLREISALLPGRRFDCVVCNPPYYPVGHGKTAVNPALAAARTEQFCTLADVCQASARLLRTGGSLYLVHKPERLCDVFCALRAQKLEPKQLRFVRHSADKPASLILVKAVQNGNPGLQCQPDLLLHSPDGEESEEYRRIYHL